MHCVAVPEPTLKIGQFSEEERCQRWSGCLVVQQVIGKQASADRAATHTHRSVAACALAHSLILTHSGLVPGSNDGLPDLHCCL